MAYVKVGPWVNGAAPALSAANLDTIETQYDEAVAEILTIAETEVHAAAAPVAWTDLDLSAVVGANPAIVMLKFAETANVSTPRVAVRRNGDTDEFYGFAPQTGIATGETAQNSTVHIVLLVATDAAGKIEWIAEAAGAMTVDVVAYVKGS